MKKLEDFKTFEDCCNYLNLDSKIEIPDIPFLLENDMKSVVAYAKKIVINRAINKFENKGKEWLLDYSNYNQPKYELRFDMDDSSSPLGFSIRDVVFWVSLSDFCSRLCHINRKSARYIGNQFIEIHKDFMIINKTK